MSGKGDTSSPALARLQAVLSGSWRATFVREGEAEAWWLVVKMNQERPHAFVFGPHRRKRQAIHEAVSHLAWRNPIALAVEATP